MKIGDAVPLLKETYSEWSDDKASRLAAALAYYTAFSLAPLLVIAVAVAGLFFDQSTARDEMITQIQNLVGPQGADIIKTMLENANKQGSGIVATVIGIVTLLIGATGVFVQLQDSLDTIWEVKLDPDLGIMGTIKQRLFSLAMVLGIGFLLLVSLILSAALSAFGTFVSNNLAFLEPLMVIINFLIAFVVTTLLFAAIFKFVPDAQIEWSDVWIGAAFTALLFSIGRLLLGLYLGNGSFGSTYGAAASLIIILAWVYYSAQILFFGAEFTQVYARRFGSRIQPEDDAVRLTEGERATQGMTRDKGSEPAQRPAPRQVNPQPSAGVKSMGIAGFVAGLLVGLRRKNRS